MAAMTAASRTSGIMPCGIFFDAVDTASPSFASGIIQPRGWDAQPVNCTGVWICRAQTAMPLGAGTLAFTAAGSTLTWAAFGESAGAAVAVSADGRYELASSGGKKIIVHVRPAALPGTDQTDTITVVAGGLHADWNSFFYEWSVTDQGGTWANGMLKSDGSHYSKDIGYGWNWAHVFEVAGTYTVNLTVLDELGKVYAYTQAVTIASEPVGGWETYHFAAAGDDDTGDGSIGAPYKTWAKAAAITTGAGNAENVRLRFNRGDTFTVADRLYDRVGPMLIDAYGTGNKPILSCTTVIPKYASGTTEFDVRICDLRVTGTEAALAFRIDGTHGLHLRCDVDSMQSAFHVLGGSWNIIQECTSSAIANFSCYGASGLPLALLGNDFSDSGTEWIVRLDPTKKSVTSHCDFSLPAAGKGSFRRDKASHYLILSYCTFDGTTPIGLGITGSADADNSLNTRIEGNGLDMHLSYLQGDRVAFLNNRIIKTATLTPGIVMVDTGAGAGIWCRDFLVAGNSYVSTISGSGVAKFLWFDDDTKDGWTGLRVHNNAVSIPSAPDSADTFAMRLEAPYGGFVSDYNQFYLPTQSDMARLADGYTWAEWQAAGHDTHSVNTDPGFADAAGGDFTQTTQAAGIALPELRIDADQARRPGTPNMGAVDPSVAPTVTTAAASGIGATSATAGGNVTADGGSPVTARGSCWSTTNPSPTLADCDGFSVDGNGTGAFDSNMSPLPGGTLNYHNAYATNLVGTSYGTADDFTTLAGDPATGASVSADGETLVLTYHREGGWPADMTVFSTAVCTVLAGSRQIIAETGGIANVVGETLTVTRTLVSPVYIGETVTIVSVEAGQAYSELNSETIRTAAIAESFAVTNNSTVPTLEITNINATAYPGDMVTAIAVTEHTPVVWKLRGIIIGTGPVISFIAKGDSPMTLEASVGEYSDSVEITLTDRLTLPGHAIPASQILGSIRADSVTIQPDEDITWGDAACQPMLIKAGVTTVIPVKDLRGLYFKGTGHIEIL